jgi:quercetin dioxygenase-like cupin family protein
LDLVDGTEAIHPLTAKETAMKTTDLAPLAPASMPLAAPAHKMVPPSFEDLMRCTLARVDSTEVIVSRVKLGADFELPTHFHPGEEFVYVLAGSVTLRQPGEDDITFQAGEVGRVPLEQIHSAVAGPDGVEMLAFRVHEPGKPERILV